MKEMRKQINKIKLFKMIFLIFNQMKEMRKQTQIKINCNKISKNIYKIKNYYP